MSRVGKNPIPIPEKVQVQVQGPTVRIKGPLGENVFELPSGLEVEQKDKSLVLKQTGRKDSALYGTLRALLNNSVQGVANGFEKVLEIKGLGFRASLAGDKLTLSLGFSHPVEFTVPKGVKVAVDAKTNTLTLTGTDKPLVGETAARIRALRVPEPYKATGIRYRGEHIVRKAGKTAASGGGAGGKK